jgi:hypothetical protein
MYISPSNCNNGIRDGESSGVELKNLSRKGEIREKKINIK